MHPQGDREEYDYIKVRRAPEFDCETILSTYSNTENLPTVIKLPAGVRVIGSGKKKIRLRRGVPVVEEEAPGVEESRTSGETKSVDSGSEEEEEGDSAPVETWINKRTRVETKAEKAERKRLAKEIKRVSAFSSPLHSLSTWHIHLFVTASTLPCFPHVHELLSSTSSDMCVCFGLSFCGVCVCVCVTLAVVLPLCPQAKRQQKKQVKQAFREAQVEHSQVRNRDTYGVSALKFH